MNKALLAAFSVLAVVGCGPLIPEHWPSFDSVPVPDAGGVMSAAIHAEDDAWATSAFAPYGKDAVQTCLAAFHQDLVKADPGTSATEKPLSYRASLADFLCACARGTSAEACPEAVSQ